MNNKIQIKSKINNIQKAIETLLVNYREYYTGCTKTDT